MKKFVSIACTVLISALFFTCKSDANQEGEGLVQRVKTDYEGFKTIQYINSDSLLEAAIFIFPDQDSIKGDTILALPINPGGIGGVGTASACLIGCAVKYAGCLASCENSFPPFLCKESCRSGMTQCMTVCSFGVISSSIQ